MKTNWMPPYVKIQNWTQALQIARHECGHYIAARVLGFKTGFCSIQLDFPNGHRGESEIILRASLRTSEDLRSYIERRVQVLYAGTLAEALEGSEINNNKALELIKVGGDQDHAKVRELVNLLRNHLFPDTPLESTQNELDQIDQDLWNRATELVLREREIIQGLAARLASEVKGFSVRAELSVNELDKLPALVKRFGKTTMT
jgi:hypothetical protein